jgi:hypothetical protein
LLGRAVFAAGMVEFGFFMWVMMSVDYLAPIRGVIWKFYLVHILVFAADLFVLLVAGFYFTERWLRPPVITGRLKQFKEDLEDGDLPVGFDQ